MSASLLAKAKDFYAKRFSLRDNSLWRLMGLLKPFRRQVILANIALTIGQAMAGLALVSLYPVFSATEQIRAVQISPEQAAKDAAASLAEPAADPAKPGKPKLGLIVMLENTRAYQGARAWVRENRDAMRAQIASSPRRFVIGGLGVVLLLYAAAGAFRFYGEYTMSTVATKVSGNLMRDVYANVLRQELAFFDRQTTGSLLNVCVREMLNLRSIIMMIASRRIMLPVTIVISVLVLLCLSARLTLLLAVLLPIVILPVSAVTRRMKRQMQGELNQESGAMDVMAQGFGGIQAIKAFGAEGLESQQIEPAIDQFVNKARMRRMAQSFIGPLVDVLNIAVLMILIVVALFAFPDTMSSDPKRLLFFLFALTRFYKPLRTVMTMNLQMQRAQSVSGRIFGLLDRRPEVAEAEHPVAFPADWRELRFEDVGLVYSIPRARKKKKKKQIEREALAHVDLAIRRGETVVLAGPNGAGKSSIVKLICRLYQPTSGRILFGGVPLDQIRIAELREQVCLITQHPVLFDRPVAENIAFGLTGIPQEALEAAARAVRAHDFISRLPKGYRTTIGETGKLLSGGERQKIVLARAFIRNPSLLILDEPTAGLDQRSQAELMEVIDDLRRRGMTILWITHDREHFAKADRILELTPERTVQELAPAGA